MRFRFKWIVDTIWVRKNDEHAAFSRDVSNIINYLKGELLRDPKKQAHPHDPNNK